MTLFATDSYTPYKVLEPFKGAYVSHFSWVCFILSYTVFGNTSYIMAAGDNEEPAIAALLPATPIAKVQFENRRFPALLDMFWSTLEQNVLRGDDGLWRPREEVRGCIRSFCTASGVDL